MLARRVIEHLIARGIVLESRPDQELPPGKLRYAAGPNALTNSDLPDGFNRRDFTGGLDVETGRRVFDTGENGLDAIACPSCELRHEPAEIEWLAALGEWFKSNGPGMLACPSCGQSVPLVEWIFDPTWGFGELAFTFTDWPLSDSFIREISEVLGHRVAYVHCHV